MILASDIYKKFEDEFKPVLAKNKLMNGDMGSVSSLVFSKVLSAYKGKELVYRDDLAIDLNDFKGIATKALKSGRRYLLEYNSGSGIHVDTNLQKVRYIHLDTYDLGITGSSDTDILEIKLGKQIVRLNYFPFVSKCIVGVDDVKGLDYCDNCVCINTSRYVINSSFNNQHYRDVYLSENTARDMYSDCFNNCTIDNLYIRDKNLSKHIDLESCFKFTKVGNISIESNRDINVQHLLNRFEYMRSK